MVLPLRQRFSCGFFVPAKKMNPLIWSASPRHFLLSLVFLLSAKTIPLSQPLEVNSFGDFWSYLSAGAQGSVSLFVSDDFPCITSDPPLPPSMQLTMHLDTKTERLYEGGGLLLQASATSLFHDALRIRQLTLDPSTGFVILVDTLVAISDFQVLSSTSVMCSIKDSVKFHVHDIQTAMDTLDGYEDIRSAVLLGRRLVANIQSDLCDGEFDITDALLSNFQASVHGSGAPLERTKMNLAGTSYMEGESSGTSFSYNDILLETASSLATVRFGAFDPSSGHHLPHSLGTCPLGQGLRFLASSTSQGDPDRSDTYEDIFTFLLQGKDVVIHIDLSQCTLVAGEPQNNFASNRRVWQWRWSSPQQDGSDASIDIAHFFFAEDPFTSFTHADTSTDNDPIPFLIHEDISIRDDQVAYVRRSVTDWSTVTTSSFECPLGRGLYLTSWERMSRTLLRTPLDFVTRVREGRDLSLYVTETLCGSTDQVLRGYRVTDMDGVDDWSTLTFSSWTSNLRGEVSRESDQFHRTERASHDQPNGRKRASHGTEKASQVVFEQEVTQVTMDESGSFYFHIRTYQMPTWRLVRETEFTCPWDATAVFSFTD